MRSMRFVFVGMLAVWLAACHHADQADPPVDGVVGAVELMGRAVLPAATFADGPTSGRQLGEKAINGAAVPFSGKQPVQGFSAIQPVGDGSYLAMSDNGFGRLENSADYHLRVYRIRPAFKTAAGGDGMIRVESYVSLRDPAKHVPFAITNHFTDDRVLTGADFDIESFQIAPDGTWWIGDEFGPFLLHFAPDGALLEPPIPLPDFRAAGGRARFAPESAARGGRRRARHERDATARAAAWQSAAAGDVAVAPVAGG